MDLVAALVADAAVVERGKLYIHGAGWDTVWAASFPTTHPTMALALLFRIEYSEALTDIPIAIELLDDDDQPVGGIKVEGKINVGHAPGTKPGAPIFVPQAITVPMLQFAKEGSYTFRITTGTRVLGTAVFRVASAASIPGLLTPGAQ
jgi:hypothetical protein